MRKGKRVLSLILCTSLMVTSLSASGFANTESKGNIYMLSMGDADSDGDVDLQDVLIMEKYIAEEESAGINQQNADITVDGVVDETDVQFVKDYLVGNTDSLVLDTCTVTFNTNGGGKIEPIVVGKGYSIKSKIPTPTKTDGVFAGWEMSDGSKFYQTDVVTDDITLNAVYEDISYVEQLHIDSFALVDQETDVSFSVEGDFDSVEEVEENITLVTKDGKPPVEVEVTEESEGSYNISAKDSFVPGGSYALTLGDGLDFVDKESNIRTANFIIKKEEQDKIVFNNSLIFVKDTEEMTYSLDNEVGTHDMLDTTFISNDENGQEVISGTFNMTGDNLSVGDVVCIYENVDPRERDYTKNNYDDDSMAYIRIVDIEGDKYSFESLSSEDAGEVMMMPDSIPFKVNTLPTGDTGTVNVNDYDAGTRVLIGKSEEPEYNVGDFLIFYTVDIDQADENTEAVYGQVTAKDGDTVSYKIVTKDYIENYMGLFVRNEVDSEELLDNIDEEEMLAQIEKDAENSGFVDEAIPAMVQSALESPDTVKALSANGFSDAEIKSLKTMAATSKTSSADGKLKFFVEHKDIDADFGRGDRFSNGLKVVLWVDLVLSINRKDGNDVNSVKLELNASFEEEVAVSVDADIDDEWDWYLFIPVLDEVTCDISVDIKNFTSASLGIQFYTLLDKYDEEKWEAYTKLTESRKVKDDLRELNNLEAEAEKEQDEDSLKAIYEKIKNIKDGMPTVTAGDKEYTFEEIWYELEKEDVADAFANGKSKNQEEAKIFMDRLMDKYSNMVQSETDWIELVNVELIKKEFRIYFVAIKVTGNFIIRTQANVSMGANVEYQVGKRYNFWIKILSGKAGSNEMDILDERFGFQLYIMGSFALRAGVKLSLDVGVITTAIASIGANVEFGPYMKLYGYFCYVYTKHRPKNTGIWISDEEMLGALYFEFGLYLIMNFRAAALADTFVYEKTLIDKEWPLLTAGQKSSVYDFANEIDEGEELAVRDEDADSRNGITMKIPDSYLQMKTMMLQTGEKKQETYDRSNYIFSVSDRRFSVDKNGVITVNPAESERYLTADLTITWKLNKYAFSKYDMTITVPIVWTNMSTTELNEKFTASVAVGNLTDGYDIVWSDKYGRLDTFDLPTEEEVLELIGYDAYNSGNKNLKYSEVGGYQTESTGLSLVTDTVYYFDIIKEKYSIEVNGVQKEDGTTESRTYTATYGEAFDFSNLQYTGTNDPVNIVFTEFFNLTLEADNSVVFDRNTVVDSTFAEEYGASVDLTANYLDNTHEAIFTFVGIDAPDVTVKFKNNQQPYFEGLTEYVEQCGGESAKIIGISPALTKMNRSVKYVVNCSLETPAPKYTLTFDTNGGNQIKSQRYTENSVIFRPRDPVRTGYTFAGWYSDESFGKAFSFDGTMPGEDVTVYAKWTANKYNVTLVSKLTNETFEIEATYDSAYGKLAAPSHADYRFTGWNTAEDGSGDKVTADDVFNETADVTLYATWVEKLTITTAEIKEVQTTTTVHYNETKQKYDLKLPTKYSDLTGFRIWYKKQSSDEDWTEELPVRVGVYDIKITREYDDNYKSFPQNNDECIIYAGLDIKKGYLNLGTPKAYRMGKTVVVSLPEGAKGDGKVTYHYGSMTNNYGIFTSVEPVQYAPYKVSIAEGTNYYAATTETNYRIDVEEEYQSGQYKAYISVDFRSSPPYGGTFDMSLMYWSMPNAAPVKWDGRTLQETNGTNRLAAEGIEPWDIRGFYVGENSKYFAVDKVTISLVDSMWNATPWTYIDDVDRNYGMYGGSGHMIMLPSWNFECSNFYARRITEIGNFMTDAGDDEWNLSEGTDYSFKYNGLISDQYYKNYNPFARVNPPSFSVSSGNDLYDKYIRYTGVTGFEVDGEGLRSHLKAYGGSDFEYTVSWNLAGTNYYYTRKIKVNVSDYLNSLSDKNAAGTASTYSLKQPTAQAGTYSMSSVQGVSDTYIFDELAIDKPADVYKSVTTLETDKTVVVNVPISITDEVSAWGVLADVKYDDSVLELVGYEYGDTFIEDEFVVQKDITKDYFRFLAVNDSFENNSIKDNLITLKFVRLKENAPVDSYRVSTQLIQAVSVDAEEVSMKFNEYSLYKEQQMKKVDDADKSADDSDTGNTEKDSAGTTDSNKVGANKTDADKPKRDKADANKTDADKPNEDKADVNKTDADKPNEDKADVNKTITDKTDVDGMVADKVAVEENAVESDAEDSENQQIIVADNEVAVSDVGVQDDSADKDSAKVDASKEVSIVVNAEETNKMVYIIIMCVIALAFSGTAFYIRKRKVKN